MKKFLKYSLVVIIGFVVFAFLLFAVRQRIVKAEIEREWQQPPAAVSGLETTTRLEIIPLYEKDRVDESLEFGHGVSYLIRTDSTTILMDLGHNLSESAQTPSLRNMQALGMTWDEIDAVIISHPHPDHVGGMNAWQTQTVSFDEPDKDLSQMPVYVPIPLTASDGKAIYSAEPALVSADIGTTGVIPFLDAFPINRYYPKGYEQALVVNVSNQGLVLITGCGHPTLERLVSRAEMLYGEQVIGVVGGLHYGSATSEEVQPHIQFLESRRPTLIALSPHDSSSEVIEAFRATFPEAYRYIKVGEAIQFP